MNRGMKAFLITLTVVVLVAGGFIGGFLYAEIPGAVPPVPTLTTSGTVDPGALVDEVDRLITDDALAPSAETSRVAGAIQGMLGSLEDTYAVYFSPKEFTDLKEMQTGEFFGVGVAVGIDASSQPYAVRVFPDSPASRAGLKTGDVFSAVGTVRKAVWNLEDFVGMVRGPAGTTVTLEITRKGSAPFKVTLTRARITTPSTITKTYGTVGYVHLLAFNDKSAAELRGVIEEFDKNGAKGYVLDLRQNPGGLLDSAVDVVSLFVKSGVAVRVDERGKPEEVLSVSGDQATTKPMVVLVDGGTASASEIVSGALKDHARAIIIGQQSYGKGSVQSVQPISNGGAVKMTIAHYLTPQGHKINGVGVTPDVVVTMDPMLQLDAKTDTQLTRALAVLRAKL
jgi:carboxyl-terminal processing protease